MEKTHAKKKKPVSRRDFLKGLSGGAVGATIAARVLGQTKAPAQGQEVPVKIFTTKAITLTVNGKNYPLEVDPKTTLLEALRDRLGLTGTKKVCNRGECGGCTVLLDGKPFYSCMTLAVRADGHEVTTIEGLADGAKLHPVQAAFIEKDGYQCGFCTPGFIMASVALLKTNPAPTQEDIRAGLSGNLCRCGNYFKIYEAVASASEKMKKA